MSDVVLCLFYFFMVAMNRNLVGVLGLVTFGLLSGCATLNEDQCLVADWYQIGFTDGANGEPETYLQEHQKACAKHGVATNLDEWLYGREAGLQRYCTSTRGFDEGLNNRTYHGVCLGEAGYIFESAYQEGQAIYQQQQLVTELENEIDSIHDELEDLDDNWRHLKSELVDGYLTASDRAALVNRLDDIKDRTAELNRQRSFLSGRLDHEYYVLKNMQR